MAERSTATSPPQRSEHSASARRAPDAEPSQDPPPAAAAAAEQPLSTPPYEPPSGAPEAAATEAAGRAGAAQPPELHSGHRLAARYRLEECITRLDGFSSWRAVDEKLRRAVGVHILSARHQRARQVLSAARSAALLGDPRFVQVLDAVEEHDVVHVIHEWLPEAVPLSTVLQAGPLEAHEAYALADQVTQAMAAAHSEGLAHLRLTPATVLRAGTGQYRIRGLAVDAALRGLSARHPQRTDTEAIGALLYAALTQRWPYSEGAYGLAGVAGLGKGTRDAPAAPDQVRAGVHRGLAELAMRALINDGATAASQEPPCTTPAELRQAIAALPRIRPPEDPPSALARFPSASYQQGAYGAGGPHAPRTGTAPAPVPPTLPGRTGAALKWAVSALLIAALVLGSWQLADALLAGDSTPEDSGPSAPADDKAQSPEASPGPYSLAAVSDFDPYGDPATENTSVVPLAHDEDPGTFWRTENYFGPGFGNLKPGVGLLIDLGETRPVSALGVETLGETGIEFRTAPPDATETPTALDDFTVVDEGAGNSLTLTSDDPVETRFVLVWLTALPQGDDGNYRGRITEISVTG